jgi:hypothetical protein
MTQQSIEVVEGNIVPLVCVQIWRPVVLIFVVPDVIEKFVMIVIRVQ